jgi:hypothetical protein
MGLAWDGMERGMIFSEFSVGRFGRFSVMRVGIFLS